MNLKYLIKKILNRTTRFNHIKNHASISDGFIWRTDHNFSTIFNTQNIIKDYFLNDAKIKLHFYDKNYNHIKSVFLNTSASSFSSLVIDENFIGTKDFGIFHIEHIFDVKRDKKVVITDRSYVGYSKHPDNLFSYVHGNSHMIIYEKNKPSKNIIFSNNVSNDYFIQKNFKEYDYLELAIINLVDVKIHVNINNYKLILNPNNLRIVKFDKIDLIKINSTCFRLRPIVFCYKNGFFDVLHC